MAPNKRQPVCLTIAGLDPSGGAGVLADIKTFSAFGCFGAAAVTSITFQNTVGVFGAEHLSAAAVRRQLEPIFDDYEVTAVKTGMLPTRETIEAVADSLVERNVTRLVVDPVLRSTSGYDLIDDEALAALVEKLFPLAILVTPNIPEAERITGIAIDSPDSMTRAARQIQSLGAANVLIKGGHGANKIGMAIDHLYQGETIEAFESEYIDTTSTHGTGCTLSAGITAEIALGKSLSHSVRNAKSFVSRAIKNAPGIGRGHGPVNHLIKF